MHAAAGVGDLAARGAEGGTTHGESPDDDPISNTIPRGVLVSNPISSSDRTWNTDRGLNPSTRPRNSGDIVIGTACRATVDAVDPQQRDQPRTNVAGSLRTANVRSVRTDTVFATAVKPPATKEA